MIDPDSVPSTMREAVDHLVAVTNLHDRDCIRQMVAEAQAKANSYVILDSSSGKERVIKSSLSASMHFGLGMHLRNEWSFWEPDTPIKRDCAEKYKIAHADDLSGLLLEWAVHEIAVIPFDPVAYCERFHAHWAEHGMTSIEAGTPTNKP